MLFYATKKRSAILIGSLNSGVGIEQNEYAGSSGVQGIAQGLCSAGGSGFERD